MPSFPLEWQALQWASRRGVDTRLIDLPQTHAMAIEWARQEALKQAIETEADPAQASPPPPQPEPALDEPAFIPGDPLDGLAQAAGFEDGEAWWNRLVEERGDSEALFESINEAMTAVRGALAEDGAHGRGAAYEQREALREAHMRQCIRAASKAGYQRIAVVCGAWHVPALQENITAKADNALLKGLPKAKVQATWAPWTYRNLARSSGYGAGVASPGWYEHLWRCYQPGRGVNAMNSVANCADVSMNLKINNAEIIDNKAEEAIEKKGKYRRQPRNPAHREIRPRIRSTQIAIAEGRGLPMAQADVPLTGHAIECRISPKTRKQLPARNRDHPAAGRATAIGCGLKTRSTPARR